MNIPRYIVGDMIYFSAQLDDSDKPRIYIMKISKAYYENNTWKYNAGGEMYDIEALHEHRIMGKCII